MVTLGELVRTELNAATLPPGVPEDRTLGKTTPALLRLLAAYMPEPLSPRKIVLEIAPEGMSIARRYEWLDFLQSSVERARHDIEGIPLEIYGTARSGYGLRVR